MLNNAINLKPNAIGLAALSTEACLEAIQTAKDAGIPIIGFDSGVPGAPKGAVYANASTDNYKAGQLAAENTYPLIKDKINKKTIDMADNIKLDKNEGNSSIELYFSKLDNKVLNNIKLFNFKDNIIIKEKNLSN